MEWYYVRGCEKIGPVTKASLLEEFQGGTISGETLVWQQGMADWITLSEAFERSTLETDPEQPSLSPDPTEAGFDESRNRRQYRYLAFGAAATCVLLAGLEIVAIALDFANIARAHNFQNNGLDYEHYLDVFDGLDIAVTVVSLGYLLVFLVSSVVFFLWLWRSYARLYDNQVPGLTYSPGWSIGWFFIPIANYFKPYYAIKDLAQASMDPISWQWKDPKISLLSLYWGFHVVASLATGPLLRRSLEEDTLDELIANCYLFIASEAAGIVSFVAVALLIIQITQNQLANLHFGRARG